MIATVLILLPFSTIAASQKASPEPFSVANDSVNNAFSSIYNAEQNGGNVSSLVERLNVAILLIQRANAENATDPSAAAADVSNATSIAQMVALTSTSVSRSGSTAREVQLYESLVTIVVTVVVATLAYFKGDRVYRRLWLYVYKNHLVKKTDE
jgi:predicted PurR-regulated permease PerM